MVMLNKKKSELDSTTTTGKASVLRIMFSATSYVVAEGKHPKAAARYL